MNPLLDLVKLLKTPSSFTGEVMAVSGKTITLSSSRGVNVVENPTATRINVGDSVVVEYGTIVGKLRKTANIPVHYV